MGEPRALGLCGPLVRVGEQLVIDVLADHGNKFFGHGIDDAGLADEGPRVLGAPPVEVGSTRAPVTTVPLCDSRGDASIVFDDVVASQRQLPADFGLERYVALRVVDRHDVQCATGAPMEIGSVEEDARVLDQPGDDLAVLLDPSRGLSSLGLELPLVISEPLGCTFNAPAVLFVSEVGAVAAAPLYEFGGRLGQNPLAARPEDAGPVALEERNIEHPGALHLGVLKTHPFVGVRRYGSHNENLVGDELGEGHL